MNLLISFDDTGSMSSVRHQVRRRIESLVDELFQVVPDLRIGIIIHNDYCDRDLVQALDFTSIKEDIVRFIHRDSSQGGGDHREAYAYVLHEMRGFGWNHGDRAAILIGDAPPHEKGRRSAGVTEKYDWREEVEELKRSGVNVYPVQALNHGREERKFYEGVASIAGTVKLDLAQFHHISQYITAIVHKEAGTIEEYAASKPEFSSNISLRNMFAKLTGKRMDDEFEAKRDLLARFQVSDVDEDCPINKFVNDMGIKYRAGKGFYEWTKTETVQEKKQILFINRETGETIMDTAWCREQLGIPLGTRGKIYPRNSRHIRNVYDVFIQSTSQNRKLKAKTRFLYELDAK